MTAHLPTGCPASLPAKAKLQALIERKEHIEGEIRTMEDRKYLIEHEIAECQAAMVQTAKRSSKNYNKGQFIGPYVGERR